MMRRLSFVVAIGIVVVFGVVLAGNQAVARTNPPANHSVHWDSAGTEQLVHVACPDCHSDATKWPWDSHIVPVSLMVGCNMSRSASR